MGRFLIARALSAIPTMLLVSIIVFALMRAIPGDPAKLMLGDLAEPGQVAAARAAMGLDEPLAVQFLIWGGDVLSGDLGRSIATGDPVLPVILDRFAITLTVAAVAVALAALIAAPAGMIAAWRQDRPADFAVIAAATLSLSIPSFWLGLILLLVFGLTLGWVPIVGFVPVWRDLGAGALYLALPVLTLVLAEFGPLARMTRASAIEVSRLEYITHARAKGLSERTVMWRHAFPNAFAPTWTLIGLVLGSLLANMAVTETVFSIPGLGRHLVDAIYARDYPVVQGCLLFIAGIYVAVNLVVDLLYPLFDPRVAA
ncbi:MAG: ABC transporter permease [Pikeienuella sp.]|uniref:ABC transporter permease n=1 Tax=Pikeienuella sp. TaxID=2831957 RepID=UPI00391CE17B